MKKQLVLMTVVGLLAASSLQAGIEHERVQAAQARTRMLRRVALRKAAHEREQKAYLEGLKKRTGNEQLMIGPLSKQTRQEMEREARDSTSRNESRDRRASDAAKAAKPKPSSPYDAVGVAENASAREVLGIAKGEALSDGLVYKMFRDSVKAYHSGRFKEATTLERTSVIELLSYSRDEMLVQAAAEKKKKIN